MEDPTEKHYTIRDRRFYQTELVWGQVRWLHARLKGYPLTALTAEQVLTLFSEELAGILSIVLIEEGKTPADKVAAGKTEVAKLESWLDAYMLPDDAIPVMKDFFSSAQLPRLLAELGTLMSSPMIPARTGSSAPLSISAGVMPASSPGSSAT